MVASGSKASGYLRMELHRGLGQESSPERFRHCILLPWFRSPSLKAIRPPKAACAYQLQAQFVTGW